MSARFRLASLESRFPILESKVDRERAVDAGHNGRLGEMPAPHFHQPHLLGLNRGDDTANSEKEHARIAMTRNTPKAQRDADNAQDHISGLEIRIEVIEEPDEARTSVHKV